MNDGSIWSGAWENGTLNGHGYALFGDKSWYEGNWFEGMRHGEGFYEYEEYGVSTNGYWRNDKYVGKIINNEEYMKT